MRPSRRVVGMTVAAALTVAAAVTTTDIAMADPADEIDWQPCEDVGDDEVYCATIAVPLDYADPDGETIEIGLAKRPAANPDERIGSLVVDPGGPGGSGVDMVMNQPVGTERVQERFDLIGFDPRGVNTSTPIQCDSDDLEAVGKLGVPTDDESFAAIAAANTALAEGCRELTGPLFDHADNLHTVEDIERVRQALGDEKLNFLGYSYGTLMGQQYAEKYPENIRTMVMDGNMDHSLADSWEFASTETAAMERNFNSFAAWCDETAECVLNGQDTAKVFGEVRDKAKAGELTDPESGDPIDFYALGDRVFSANNPAAWPDLAADLKALHEGSGKLRLSEEPLGEPVESVFQSHFCSDWDVAVDDFAAWEDITTRLAEEYPNTQWSSYVTTLISCIGGAVETTNPQAPLEIEGAPPLVMLGNHNDFATVYEWSEVAAEQSGATLITYEGYGHCVYGLRDIGCVNEPVDDYLIDLKVPDEGISCENQDVPGGEDTDRSVKPSGVGPWQVA